MDARQWDWEPAGPGGPAPPPPAGGLDDEALALACKALGHPARLAILRHLLAENRCICGRIVDVLPLAQSTVSQHLKVLRQAGLVRGEVSGPRICYCLDQDGLAALGAAVAALCARVSGQDCRPLGGSHG